MSNEIYAQITFSCFPNSQQMKREYEEFTIELKKTHNTLINILKEYGLSDNEINSLLDGTFDEKKFTSEILNACREYFHLRSRDILLYYRQERYDIEVYNCYSIKDELKQRHYNFNREKHCWSTAVCGADWQEEFEFLQNHGITIKQNHKANEK